MSKYIYVQFIFMFCLLTMALFLYYDHFEGNQIKIKLYYLWDKSKDFLLLFGYSFFLKGKLRLSCIFISAFFLVRLVWQIWEMEDYASANKPYVIDYLFLTLMLAYVLIMAVFRKQI